MTLAQLEKRVVKLERLIQRQNEEREYRATLEGIRSGLADMKAGRGIPIDEAFRKIHVSGARRKKAGA